MACLQWTLYEHESDLHHSDQITVHIDVWRQFDATHEGSGPIFVDMGGAVGRIHPARVGLGVDSCQIPDWMWRLADPDPGSWLLLRQCDPPVAAKMTLRAHYERTLTESADPVVMLTAALCGDSGHSWAVLNVGQLLSLTCGDFDVVGLEDASGSAIYAGMILNTDVKVEFVPAVDHVVAPAPAVGPMVAVPGKFVPFPGAGRRLG